MKSMIIRSMTPADYESVANLWRSTEGLGDTPKPEAFHRFLSINPGFSQVALDESTIIGALLVSFDGIRGYLYRLAVAKEFRHQGIARTMIEAAQQTLVQAGADRINLHILASNPAASEFWRKMGWVMDSEISFWRKGDISCPTWEDIRTVVHENEQSFINPPAPAG
jgi:ribosomal protein S18 acetylase RimI-like enzyme